MNNALKLAEHRETTTKSPARRRRASPSPGNPGEGWGEGSVATRIALPVLAESPATPAEPARMAPPRSEEGDPFNPHKILNHFDRISAFVRGELVYPITVEIDPTNVCNHRCKWCVSI